MNERQPASSPWSATIALCTAFVLALSAYAIGIAIDSPSHTTTGSISASPR